MSIIAFLRYLLPLIKDQKAFAGTIILSAALGYKLVGYVDAKHKDGIDQIMALQKKVELIERREYRSQVSLDVIQKSVEEVAKRMGVMDQRIWELYRDRKQSKIYGRNNHPQEELWERK